MIEIKTNHHWRIPLYWWDLNEEEQKEFDYLSEDEALERNFLRYRGTPYDAHEFLTTSGLPEVNELTKWDGYHSESFCTGVVIRWSSDFEEYQIGSFISISHRRYEADEQ